jgi:hypothetical protein
MRRYPVLAVLLLCLALPPAVQAETATPSLQMPLATDLSRRQISVVVTPGLTSTKKLPTPELRQARKDMFAGVDLPPETLRALADKGDGLAAQKYVRLLVRMDSASPSDVAYYGTIAVRTGRVWSLPDVVTALYQLDPATEPDDRKAAYAEMLYPHAWAGNTLALDAVIALNGEGKLFGLMSEATRQKIIERGTADGDGRVALQLAMTEARKPVRTEAETEALMQYLDLAAQGSDLAVRATAQNLLAVLKTPASAGTPTQ